MPLWILMLLLILSGNVTSDPTADYTYTVLHSNNCKINSCREVKPLNYNRWAKFCFGHVPEAFRYQCIHIDTYGAAEIFLPKNLVCEAGIGIKYTYVASKDAVHFTHIPCPPGTYQDMPSNCVDSCSLKHPVANNHVIIREPQNTTSMGDGYCDWKNGFFNLDGVNTFSLGQQKECVHRSEHSNQCPDTEMDIRPGGRCDKRCSVGYIRDPYAGFDCSLEIPVPPYGSVSTVGGPHTTTPTHPTTDQLVLEMDKPGGLETNVVIAVVCGAVVIFVILTLVFLLHKKGRVSRCQPAPSIEVSSTSSVNTSEEIAPGRVSRYQPAPSIEVSSTSSVNTSEEIAPASSASSVNISEKIPGQVVQKITNVTRNGCNEMKINAVNVIINQNYERNKPVDDQKSLVETFENHPLENLKETTIRFSDSSLDVDSEETTPLKLETQEQS